MGLSFMEAQPMKVIKAAKQYEVKTPFTFVIANNVNSFTSEFLLIRPSKGLYLRGIIESIL